MTPMRLCGRSASARRGLLLVLGLPMGKAKVLRSPQLRRCSRPGWILEGEGGTGVWEKPGCDGAITFGRQGRGAGEVKRH